MFINAWRPQQSAVREQGGADSGYAAGWLILSNPDALIRTFVLVHTLVRAHTCKSIHTHAGPHIRSRAGTFLSWGVGARCLVEERESSSKRIRAAQSPLEGGWYKSTGALRQQWDGADRQREPGRSCSRWMTQERRRPGERKPPSDRSGPLGASQLTDAGLNCACWPSPKRQK